MNFTADGNYQSASLQGNGTLGVTRSGFLNLDWAWQGQRYASDMQQSADVSNAYYRQDFAKKYYLQGGVMDARDIFSAAGGSINLSQLPLGKINGVRLGSTQAWINPDRVAHGTPLTLFLTRNARVDAYRGEQLLSSFYLNAGTQTLDTRTFPPGSYPVTLKVLEDNRLVRTQTLPYTGTGGSLPASFQWFIQGGAINRDSETRDGSSSGRVLQGGARFPLTQTLSFTAGSALMESAAFSEGALDWSHGFSSGMLDGVMTSRFSYLTGSGNVRGDIEQLSYSDGFSLSFYRSALRAENCGTGGAAGFAGCSQNTSLMLSVPAGEWSINLGWLSGSASSRYVLRQALPASDDRRDAGARGNRSTPASTTAKAGRRARRARSASGG
ncbi:hypothetical protein HA45_21870 [Pantoea rodasii]|nr:hypothetical protein HA45_21870 [Pantoea rodasii]